MEGEREGEEQHSRQRAQVIVSVSPINQSLPLINKEIK